MRTRGNHQKQVKSIVWSANQQGKFFNKFKENAKFIEIVKQFGLRKSTVIFKIIIVKLTDKYPKIKNSSLSLHFLKNYFKMIKEICEENSSEFELVKKNLFQIY